MEEYNEPHCITKREVHAVHGRERANNVRHGTPREGADRIGVTLEVREKHPRKESVICTRRKRTRAVWSLYLCSRPSDRSGPGCVSTDRNGRSKCRCSNVSCSSHYDAQLTAFFIDPRAK
ncbi:hypothetical protein ACJJTC_002854 [Scirpophaga incertulas]